MELHVSLHAKTGPGASTRDPSAMAVTRQYSTMSLDRLPASGLARSWSRSGRVTLCWCPPRSLIGTT